MSDRLTSFPLVVAGTIQRDDSNPEQLTDVAKFGSGERIKKEKIKNICHVLSVV